MQTTNQIERAEKTPLVLLKTDIRGYVRVPKAKREEILREYGKSGMCAADFSKLSGIKYTTLCGWIQKAGRESPKKGGRMNWLEAVVPGSMGSGIGGRAVIHVGGGIRVEAGDGNMVVEILQGLGVKGC
jgi:hypothetical protein